MIISPLIAWVPKSFGVTTIDALPRVVLGESSTGSRVQSTTRNCGAACAKSGSKRAACGNLRVQQHGALARFECSVQCRRKESDVRASERFGGSAVVQNRRALQDLEPGDVEVGNVDRK